MLFILHNNVVLSLFLRAFYYIFYTVFCTVYTYFLHILYIFYTYFAHIFCHFLPFLRKNNALLVHYWLNITHFRAFLTYFRAFFHQFPTIFCTFVQISCAFFCTLAQLCALPASSFFVLLHKLFLRIVRKLRSRSVIVCTNFFQLAAALFPACEKLYDNLFPASLQDFTASHSFFLCDYSFSLRECFCFYCFFHS